MSAWQGGFNKREKQVPVPELSSAQSQKWQVCQEHSHDEGPAETQDCGYLKGAGGLWVSAVSSTIFLNRYFPPIIFGQKWKKKIRSNFFFQA